MDDLTPQQRIRDMLCQHRGVSYILRTVRGTTTEEVLRVKREIIMQRKQRTRSNKWISVIQSL
jgi:hypothetical protein